VFDGGIGVEADPTVAQPVFLKPAPVPPLIFEVEPEAEGWASDPPSTSIEDGVSCTVGTTGAAVMPTVFGILMPFAAAIFRSSRSSLFRSFSFRFSASS